jgi:hypothetical protein
VLGESGSKLYITADNINLQPRSVAYNHNNKKRQSIAEVNKPDKILSTYKFTLHKAEILL